MNRTLFGSLMIVCFLFVITITLHAGNPNIDRLEPVSLMGEISDIRHDSGYLTINGMKITWGDCERVGRMLSTQFLGLKGERITSGELTRRTFVRIEGYRLPDGSTHATVVTVSPRILAD